MTKINYGPFQAIVEKRVELVRPFLFDEDRIFQWPIACIKVCLPSITAIFFFLALTPQNWNVSDSWISFFSYLKIFSLIGLVFFGCYSCLILAAVFEAHHGGWKMPKEKEKHPLDYLLLDEEE